MPARDIVVVHSSDIHVDSGYEDGTASLRRVVAAAQRLRADLLLLAGDTFENNRLPVALLEAAAAALRMAGMPVVLLPGNHDPAIAESAFRRGGLDALADVHILGVTHDEAVQFPAFDLEVWGHAHRDYGDMLPLRHPRRRSTQWQIAVAHGHYEAAPNRTARLNPSWLISDAEIAATGADYVALGHWNRAVKVGDGAIEAYYSGSPDLAATVNLVRLARDGRVLVRREALL